jgi:peptidoglycan/xylan/chitin deacetylase (PgdA/CDA1 family)
MRAAVVIGGLLIAGGLGAYGAVEAQKYPITHQVIDGITTLIRTATAGPSTTTTASAQAEAPAAQPQTPRTVVSDVTAVTAVTAPQTAPAAQATSAPPTQTAQASPPTPPAAPAPAVQVAAAQNTPAPQAAAPAAEAAPAAQPAPPSTPGLPAASARIPYPLPPPINCTNPNAIGIARTVQIDTTEGPGFGLQHFRNHDFLNDHEVVLTFDDGPWLNHTPMVLKALADQCTRATFFAIGLHSTYYPEILKQVAAAGNTVGSHTWSHKDLSKMSAEDAKTEIEKGFSAVHAAVGGPTAPFFRFPDLRHPPEMVTYLGQRNVGIFSCDFDSFDFKLHRPQQVVKSVMDKLAKHGKGIILMHDFQKATAEALPEILAKLKAGGYKIVHMVPKYQVQTLPQYDEAVLKDQKLPTLDQRPTSSIVHTIQ